MIKIAIGTVRPVGASRDCGVTLIKDQFGWCVSFAGYGAWTLRTLEECAGGITLDAATGHSITAQDLAPIIERGAAERAADWESSVVILDFNQYDEDEA